MQLDQVKAVVTGGASGLGFAVAKHLAAHGGKVALLDVNDEKGNASAAEIGATYFRADVTNEDGIVATLKDAHAKLGVIVNTASVAAYEGQIGQAAYSASKGGVVGMTLPMAREFARIGVRVMTIAPGIFWTPMVDGMPESVQQSLSASIPFPSRL